MITKFKFKMQKRKGKENMITVPVSSRFQADIKYLGEKLEVMKGLFKDPLTYEELENMKNIDLLMSCYDLKIDTEEKEKKVSVVIDEKKALMAIGQADLKYSEDTMEQLIPYVRVV